MTPLLLLERFLHHALPWSPTSTVTAAVARPQRTYFLEELRQFTRDRDDRQEYYGNPQNMELPRRGGPVHESRTSYIAFSAFPTLFFSEKLIHLSGRV